MKKKLLLTLTLALTALIFSGCGEPKKTLKVYNAGEYIDESLLPKFEKEYGCKVVYETFDSNESMYTKLSSGEKYDILIPSDYMIERLIKENYLQKLDWSKITNKDNIMPEVLNRGYDPESEYSVPYFWGSVGILYDKTIVDSADLTGWDVLRNEKYKGNIYMYDSERDSFAAALKSLEYSLNTDNTAELDAAYNWLVEQNNEMAPIYVGDEVIDNMISGNKCMAVVYSGDAAYIMTENENLGYFMPPEGTNLWYDAMVMTKDCTDTELAHSFMNFMTDSENALANTEKVGYSSAVKSAFDTMKETTYKGINAYIPRSGNDKDEIFEYQTPEIKKYCAELWTKVKSN